MRFPMLDTQRLTLNQLEGEDAEPIFKLFSDKSVIKYYDLVAFTEVSQANAIIAFFNSRYIDNAGIRWAIRLKESGELIGTCGFNSWSSKMNNAVIGYDLSPVYWGNGYVTEALHEIILAAFSGVLSCGALHRIQADTVPGNSASEAVLRRIGFREEGLRRQSGFWKGEYHDLKCFGLLKPEYNIMRCNG
ncbi:GNAT family N-acetyltransferase [Gammaproteobacteria bacterium 45_16_T64]|nr:GNAT family N-acetyltransferase [Gammaproteobacteria bacterium 45_16_T64]